MTTNQCIDPALWKLTQFAHTHTHTRKHISTGPSKDPDPSVAAKQCGENLVPHESTRETYTSKNTCARTYTLKSRA